MKLKKNGEDMTALTENGLQIINRTGITQQRADKEKSKKRENGKRVTMI